MCSPILKFSYGTDGKTDTKTDIAKLIGVYLAIFVLTCQEHSRNSN